MCVDYTGLNKHVPKIRLLCLALTKSLTRRLVGTFVFSRCILRIQPDQDEEVGPIGHFVHYPIRHVLLCHDALRAEKRRCYLPADNATLTSRPNWSERSCLCGRYRGDV